MWYSYLWTCIRMLLSLRVWEMAAFHTYSKLLKRSKLLYKFVFVYGNRLVIIRATMISTYPYYYF